MRFERKFETQNSDKSLLFSLLKSFDFVEVYSERNISSIYYDTREFTNYFDSESGISNRKKIRIRYYSDNFNNPLIEHKIKQAELGKKDYTSLKDFTNSETLPVHFIKSLNQPSNIFIPKKIDLVYLPNVFITYRRKYLESNTFNIRITLDNKIRFSSVNLTKGNFIVNRNVPSESSVLEIKYDQKTMLTEEFCENISQKLNLNSSRFSKYCDAVNYLNP